MNKMIKACIAIALTAVLAACMSTLGRSFNEDYAQQIKSGETTKAEVLDKLGRPVLRRPVAGDEETWTYAYYSGPASWTSWIASTTEDEYGIRSRSGRQVRLVLVFKGDVVKSSKFTQEIPRPN